MFRLALQARKPSSYLNQGAIFPWYDSTFLKDTDLAYPNMVLQPGDVWWEQDVAGYGISNAFQYVKTSANLTDGQLVARATPATDTVVAAGSTVATVNLTAAAPYVANAEVGNLIYFENGNAGTGYPTLRVIKSNTTNSVTVAVRDQNNTFNANDADVLGAIPTNGTNVTIIRKYTRQVCTATLVPCGVALGAVTAASTPYTIVQVAGVALVQAIGNGTATVVGQPAIPSAAGVIIGAGGNQGAAPVITLYNAGSSIIPAHVWAGAAAEKIPCDVNFLGVL